MIPYNKQNRTKFPYGGKVDKSASLSHSRPWVQFPELQKPAGVRGRGRRNLCQVQGQLGLCLLSSRLARAAW